MFASLSCVLMANCTLESSGRWWGVEAALLTSFLSDPADSVNRLTKSPGEEASLSTERSGRWGPGNSPKTIFTPVKQWQGMFPGTVT